MLHFESIEQFYVDDKKVGFVITNNRDRKPNDTEDFYPRVKIDGKVYETRSISGMGTAKGYVVGNPLNVIVYE